MTGMISQINYYLKCTNYRYD